MTPHFYNWHDGFSTDSNWNPDNRSAVHYNGLIQHHVICCFTGDNGFIRSYVTNNKGNVEIEGDCLKTKTVRGKVEITYEEET